MRRNGVGVEATRVSPKLVDRIYHLVPSFDSGDHFIGICGPAEGFWVFILLGDEAVDGSLKIDNRVEHTALQPSLCQLGKEAFDGIEPGTGRWRKVKGEAGMPE